MTNPTRHIGFTGTREGMVDRQFWLTTQFLCGIADDFRLVCHHGNCLGADEEFHQLCEALPKFGTDNFEMHIHPPLLTKYEASCVGTRTYERLPYLERNRKIVEVCDFLLACPKQDSEVVRSGTWATVRYAREANKPYLVIPPNGDTIHAPNKED